MSDAVILTGPHSFGHLGGLQVANKNAITVLLRYCDDQFDPESSTATIGIDFKVRHFQAKQR